MVAPPRTYDWGNNLGVALVAAVVGFLLHGVVLGLVLGVVALAVLAAFMSFTRSSHNTGEGTATRQS